MTCQTRLWLTDPSSTNQSFGHTTRAIACERFANRLDGGTQALILLLMLRLAAPLVIPLPVDLQQAAELAHRTGRHLLPHPLYERVSRYGWEQMPRFF